MPLRIGIDLDNTIIDYRNPLVKLVKINDKKNNLNPNQSISRLKAAIKKNISENQWQSLQGKLYSKEIDNANIYKGFKNFLLFCSEKNISVEIVSHKTKFGHHDPKKINLRDKATSFLKNKEIIGKSIQKIFFEDSIEKKVRRIITRDYDIFIDDLDKVLNHKDFPKKVIKIFFSESNNKKNSLPYIFNEWIDIRNFCKNIYYNEQIYKFFNSFNSSFYIKHIRKINKGGNSSLYKIDTNLNKSFALKRFNLNRKQYYRKEKFFYNLEKNKYMLKLLGYDDKNFFILNEWFNTDNRFVANKNDIKSLIHFVKLCNNKKIKNLKIIPRTMASDALRSKSFFFKVIENKVLYLLNNVSDVRARNLLCDIKLAITNLKFNFNQNIDKKFIYTPADIGFHNAIKHNSSIKFIDFEFSGFDDSRKVLFDFIFHPGFVISYSLKLYFIEEFTKVFRIKIDEIDPNLFKIIGLHWCVIILKNYDRDILLFRNKDNLIDKKLYLNDCYNKAKKLFDFLSKNYRDESLSDILESYVKNFKRP